MFVVFMFGKILEYRKKILKVKDKERINVFLNLEPKEQASLIFLFSNKIKKFFLEKLPKENIINMFHFLAPDDITDLLQLLKKRKQKILLNDVEKEIKEKIEFLLRFNPKTAAGIMSLDYIIVDLNMTMEDIGKEIKIHEKRTGRVPVVLVKEDNKIIGELPWHNLAISEEVNRNFVKRLPKLRYDANKEKLFLVFKAHPHSRVIVLDKDDSVLGIIYSDDIINLIEEHMNESIYKFAGVEKEEDVLDGFMSKVKHRYKWLIVNLGTAFLAAFIVSLFGSTIAKYVLLAVYMPIVAGMGGNAATQTMAVSIRGLALKEVSWINAKKVIFNEVVAGFINGFINGVILALVAIFLNQNPLLGLILFLALIINLIIAGFVGAIIPIFLKSIGKDPATISTIIITTFTDVFGFFIFLGLATLIL